MRHFFRHKAIVSDSSFIKSESDSFLLSTLNFSGFVDLDKVEDYSTNRLKFMAKGKGKAFTDAVRKIDEYSSDAMVCV